jgi:hypothetical protein
MNQMNPKGLNFSIILVLQLFVVEYNSLSHIKLASRKWKYAAVLPIDSCEHTLSRRLSSDIAPESKQRGASIN